MLDQFFTRLLMMSAQASVLILAVMLLRQLARRSISPRIIYALWLFPALRLLLPISFQSGMSLMNLLPAGASGAYPHAYNTPVVPNALIPNVTLAADAVPVPSPAPQEAAAIRQAVAAPGLTSVLFWVWACGAALLLAYMLFANIRFYISIKRLGKHIECDFRLPVYRMDGLDSPCLCGYFHPAVLVNRAALGNDAALAFVLRHELCHFRSGDQWWALVRSLCCILHWFNPIVWWAAFKSRTDCELACDAGVMQTFTQEECERYGMALLSIIRSDKPASGLMFTTTSMTGGKRELKERIRNIAKRPKTVWLAVAAAMLCFAVCGVAACSDRTAFDIPNARVPFVETEQIEQSEEPEAPPAPSIAAAETAYAELPDVFLNNAAAGEDVLTALYGYFRGVQYEEEWFDKRAADGTKIAVYAWRPYGNGLLATADFYYGGELTADLFYIENGAVKYFTSGSDVWSINYTRLFGDTVVYGKSFAWDNGIQASTRADAAFFDGQACSADMPCTANDDAGRTGFIFIAKGETWLKSLQIFNGNTLVTDETNYQFLYADLTPYKGELKVREATRFNPMYNAASWANRADRLNEQPPKLMIGEEAAGFECIGKDIDFALPDIWRSNISYFYPLPASASAAYEITGLNAADIVNAYWIDAALDNGTPKGLASCVGHNIASGGIVASGANLSVTQTPKTPGKHILIIETADAFLFTAVDVAG